MLKEAVDVVPVAFGKLDAAFTDLSSYVRENEGVCKGTAELAAAQETLQAVAPKNSIYDFFSAEAAKAIIEAGGLHSEGLKVT